MRHDWEEESVIALAKFRPEPCEIRLEGGLEVFADDDYDDPRQMGDNLRLGGYGYHRFRSRGRVDRRRPRPRVQPAACAGE